MKVFVGGVEVSSKVVKKQATIKAIKIWHKPWTWFRKNTFRDYSAVEILHPIEFGQIGVVCHGYENRSMTTDE